MKKKGKKKIVPDRFLRLETGMPILDTSAHANFQFRCALQEGNTAHFLSSNHNIINDNNW